MDYTGLIKSLSMPPEFTPPRELTHEDIRASPLIRNDLDDDVQGINASLDLIRRTRGGGWPTAAVTRPDNYVAFRSAGAASEAEAEAALENALRTVLDRAEEVPA